MIAVCCKIGKNAIKNCKKKMLKNNLNIKRRLKYKRQKLPYC